MQKIFLSTTAILGILAVSIGAFGAHKLESILKANDKLGVYNTGVQYHFYHTLALFMIALLMYKIEHKYLVYAGWCFISGIIIFSGSLYILSVTNISKLGMITPIGGALFILGWIFLFLTSLSYR